ncbi:putative ABC transporter extracellular-binding protein YurO [Spirochaetia bacterium]|nr:putative ABC transporter extracellular-binding protein YurO [Spirochaetia bacterium]
MKRLKVLLLIGLTLIIAAGSLFAAGGKQTGGSSNEITLLLLNSFMSTDDPMGAQVLKAVKEFEAENPGVKVNLQGTSQQDILEQFKTLALAGSGPDVAVMDNSGHAIDLAAMNLLLPLNNFITDADLTSYYAEGPLNSGKFRGTYYSIPWYMDNCGLLYNVKRLKDLNIEPPKTWVQLEDAISKLTKAGYGGIISYLSAYEMYPFFYQNNNAVIDTSGNTPEVVINNAAGKEAWNYWTGLHIKYGGFVESFKEANTWDKVYEPLASGEATFLIGGDWCVTGVKKLNPNLEVGILPMPEGKSKATALGGWTWNINRNSKNPKLAYDFIRYITSPERDYIIKADGRLPGRKNVDYNQYLAAYPERLVFASQVPYTKPRPAIINEKAIDKLITDAFLRVLYNQQTPQQALDQVEKELKQNITDNYK